MAGITRTTGLQATVDTVYTPGCNLYLITVKNAGATAIDLRGEDDAVNETVEAIIGEINPLAYMTADANTGLMYVIVDKSIDSASELQTRIRTIGKDAGATTTSIGPNDIDISGTTVQDVAPTASLTTSGTIAFTAAS